MQEVFEKIIDKLLGLNRLNNITNKLQPPKSMYDYQTGVIDSIDVVEYVANAYNNGWIPCSERLPEEGRFYFVTIEMWNKAYGTEYCLFEDGKWYLVADGPVDENTTWKEEIKSVIAWQALPQRYEPKDGKS